MQEETQEVPQEVTPAPEIPQETLALVEALRNKPKPIFGAIANAAS